MKALYDLINARATQTWHETINKDNYLDYVKHWFVTALEIKEEFKSEGLVDTTQAINAIIDEQKKFT